MVGGWGLEGVRLHKSHISCNNPENIFVYHCSVAKATPATYDITSRWLSQAPEHCCLNVILNRAPSLSLLFPKGRADGALVANNYNEGN